MKTLHLLIISSFSSLIILSTIHAMAIPYMSPQDLYKQNDMVFHGQVISKQEGPGPDYYYYQVKVDTYFKNPQNSDSITVAGHKSDNKTRMSYPQFEVGDKAIFYTSKLEGINTISPYSQKAGNACDIHSFLGPALLPGEKPAISSAASSLRLLDANGNVIVGSVSTNHEVVLSYDDIWNSYPESRIIPIETSILDPNSQAVFYKKQNLEMQACDGPGIIKWSYVPTQNGKYTVAMVVDNKTTISVIFEVKGDSEISSPKSILSPLQQFKSGIPISNIQCAQDLSLVIKAEDGTPACIKQDSISKLILRGWTSTTSSLDQNNSIFGDFYQGIENDSGIVSIKNQTYYMMTASNTTYPVAPGMTVKFHQVTFSFPYGSQATPGGAIIPFDMTFPDGITETYGNVTNNPTVHSISGVSLGPGPSSNRTVTVLSNHTHPQAGVTLTENQIKLLISTDIDFANIQTQTFDSSSSLKLYLSTNSQVIQPGQPIGITISVNNTLSSQVIVQDENSWKLDNLSVNPCTTAPYGIAIFDGFYSENNMTDGKPLVIFNNDANCPAYIKTTKTYEFHPSSGHVTVNNCTDTPSTCSSGYDMGNQFSFTGTLDTGQIMPFNPGIYTIVGGDEWGHVAIEHFVVSKSTIFAGNLGSMSCPAMPGGIQFGATIKNSTGFANYYNSTQYGNTLFLHPGMHGTITVQYSAPANAAWFQNNANAPFNMTSGAALFYMANVTEGKSIVSYAGSLYNDETGHHSQICHYGIQFGGGFAEPCDTDNTGDIPLGELPYASKLLHVGIDTLFEPSSVMLYPDSNPVFTAKVYANSNATSGVYWLSLGRSLCGPGVLSKLVVLP